MNEEKYLKMSMSEFLEEKLFYGIHNHSHYSNIRLRDALTTVKGLIDTAILKGHRGINLSDHECISGHIEAQEYVKELHKLKNKYNEMNLEGATEEEFQKEFKNKLEVVSKMPNDFLVSLGNEIYLVDSLEEVRDNYKSGITKFYHFVLVAKNEEGHEALRELSSHAWGNMFKTGMMERVPTIKSYLREVVQRYPNSLIASTSCLGGELGQLVLQMLEIKSRPHTEAELFDIKLKIHNFIQFGLELFGEDFVIELQPSYMAEQVAFNELALTIAKGYGIDYIIGLDAHYETFEDRLIHKAFLSSKEGEREVDDFYSSTYLMSNTEIYEYWRTFGTDKDFKIAILNTFKIKEKIEIYDLCKPELIPQRPLPEVFEVRHIFKDWYNKYQYIEKVANSPYDQDRFFMTLLEDGFIKKKQKFNDINMGRINEEFKQLWLISERLHQRMLSYYSLTELMVNIMWDDDGGNSLVGISRDSGTGMYMLYLVDVIQINPIEWELPNWRHIHSSRIELPDIDIDTETIKREQIFNAVSNYFNGNVLNLATFKTEGTKSAVQTSARGLDIDNDISMAVSSLIPFERGKHWSLHDCIYGNEEKERLPVTEFINQIKEYPKWLETAMKIEGLICGRSIHASGVCVFNDGITSSNSIMKAPNGKNTTAYSMNDSTLTSSVKLDFLTVESLTKLHTCINLLIVAGKIEWQGSLRETYNKYIHPDVLEYNSPKMWEMVATGELLDLFQFSTPIGITTAKLLKPTSLPELAHANSLMRLMGDGIITPTEKFLKFKNDISLWYKEMDSYGLVKGEIDELEKHLKIYYGVSATQEDIMEMTMNPKLVGFDLTQANKLRKAVAKKSEKVMKEVKELYFKVGKEKGNSDSILHYIWDKHIVPQLGYSFSRNHTLPYSGIALQEMNLAYKYGSLFWNCAVLICNSGADSVNLDDEESKSKATEYGKVAKAIGEMQGAGVGVSLPDINKSGLTFVPDEENNKIVFGLKGISGVGDNDIRHIMSNRPYKSFQDFLDRSAGELGTTTTIALIKAGMFDTMIDRIEAMEKYVLTVTKGVKSIGAVQLLKMIELGLISEDYRLECRFVKFRKYIFSPQFFVMKDTKTKSKKWYMLNDISTNFFVEHFMNLMEEEKDYKYDESGNLLVLDKNFDKYHKQKIERLSEYAKTQEALDNYNRLGFLEIWDKYCSGTISKWEMDSLNFYHSEHELANIDREKYSIVNFNELNEKPEVAEIVNRGKIKFTRYKLHRICGTILAKDKNKHTLQVLTPDGVVAVKFHKGAFTYYDKQLSQVDEVTGTKSVIEKSWFARGNKILVVGFRRDDQFVAKKYANSVYQHTVELISDIKNDGRDVITIQERAEIQTINKKILINNKLNDII